MRPSLLRRHHRRASCQGTALTRVARWGREVCSSWPPNAPPCRDLIPNYLRRLLRHRGPYLALESVSSDPPPARARVSGHPFPSARTMLATASRSPVLLRRTRTPLLGAMPHAGRYGGRGGRRGISSRR